MNRDEIFAKIDAVNEGAPAYLKRHQKSGYGPNDEMGGHIGYEQKVERDNICPSREFVNNLLKVCAKGLGFEYEER